MRKIIKSKDAVTIILFVGALMLGFLGTMLLSGKYIAWNVIRNNGDYRTENTVNGYANSYISAFESALNESVFLKEKYIDLFGAVQRLMRKDVIPSNGYTGTIVRGSDNKLYTANSITTKEQDEEQTNEDVVAYANALCQLKEELTGMGTDLLYVQAPQKYHEDVTLPIPIHAQALNSRTKLLLELLDGKVAFIDLAKEINEENRDLNTLFYATDHHWTTDTAFWSYQHICEYLNEYQGYAIDQKYYAAENWTKTILKNSYLGSTGVRVGSYYVGRDDFTLYTPKFETEYIRNYESTRWLRYEGDFAHAVISGDYEGYVSGKDKNLIWGTYTGSDTGLVEIQNLKNGNGRKILVVKDSFALPVCAFMSTTCSELDIYDLRYSHETSLVEHIREQGYDLVLFLYNPDALSKTFFEFFE